MGRSSQTLPERTTCCWIIPIGIRRPPKILPPSRLATLGPRSATHTKFFRMDGSRQINLLRSRNRTPPSSAGLHFGAEGASKSPVHFPARFPGQPGNSGLHFGAEGASKIPCLFPDSISEPAGKFWPALWTNCLSCDCWLPMLCLLPMSHGLPMLRRLPML